MLRKSIKMGSTHEPNATLISAGKVLEDTSMKDRPDDTSGWSF
jgi:hypothetical protein